jgi:hypothetical protein
MSSSLYTGTTIERRGALLGMAAKKEEISEPRVL